MAMSILLLKEKGVEKVRNFNFIERPSDEALDEGLELLQFFHAIDEDEKILELGKDISRMGLEPTIAKLILEGHQ